MRKALPFTCRGLTADRKSWSMGTSYIGLGAQAGQEMVVRRRTYGFLRSLDNRGWPQTSQPRLQPASLRCWISAGMKDYISFWSPRKNMPQALIWVGEDYRIQEKRERYELTFSWKKSDPGLHQPLRQVLQAGPSMFPISSLHWCWKTWVMLWLRSHSAVSRQLVNITDGYVLYWINRELCSFHVIHF